MDQDFERELKRKVQERNDDLLRQFVNCGHGMDNECNGCEYERAHLVSEIVNDTIEELIDRERLRRGNE